MRVQVRLLAPGTWSTVWRAPLDPGEVGACVAGVHLKNTMTGATHPLLAVGTALTAGATVGVRGAWVAPLLVGGECGWCVLCSAIIN